VLQLLRDQEAFAERLKIAALHGLSADAWSRFSDRGYKHYEVVAPGYKYNMTDLQATLGLCQLAHVEEWQTRRCAIWRRYDEAFADLPCFLPEPEEPGTLHAHHLYTLCIDLESAPVTRDELQQRLHEQGIGTGVHYTSLHLHEYYRKRYGFRPEDYPNAAWISARTVSLPLSGGLDDAAVERVIAGVRSVLGG
jgi:dTDP-4-amino-4,6-dideoxygalactose transaminase